MSFFFPEPYTHSVKKIKVELDFSNWATKLDLKDATGADTLKFAKKPDLASLTLEADKLHIDILAELDVDKLELVSVDLNTLSDAVDNNLVKKLYMMNLFKKLMLLILVNLIKKQIMIIRPVILKVKYQILLA